MSLKDLPRNQIRKLLTKESNMILGNRIPSYESLENKFQDEYRKHQWDTIET